MSVQVFYNGRHDECDIGITHSHTFAALPLYSVENGNVPTAFISPISGKQMAVPLCEDCGARPDEFLDGGKMICNGCWDKRRAKAEAAKQKPKCPCGAPGEETYVSFAKFEFRCKACATKDAKAREQAVLPAAAKPKCGNCKKEVDALVRGKDFCYACNHAFQKKEFWSFDTKCPMCDHAPNLHMHTRGCSQCLCWNTSKEPNYAAMLRTTAAVDNDFVSATWSEEQVREQWGKLYYFPGSTPAAKKPGWFRRALIRVALWLHRDAPARPSFTLDAPRARAFFTAGRGPYATREQAEQMMRSLRAEFDTIHEAVRLDTGRLQQSLKVFTETKIDPEEVKQRFQSQ